nr:uncharacterized protein LOC111994020 [Quercus suber]
MVKRVWSCIWQLKLSHKLRHFAWKASRNILATKDNLIRRRITEDDACVLCGQPKETTCHLLWFCKHAREIWESSKLVLPFVIDQSWTFLDIIQCLQNWETTQPSLLEKTISVCWGIWRDRNERRTGGLGKPGRVILKSALNLVEEYCATNEVRQRVILGGGLSTIWKSPDMGRYKVNVNGAVFKHRKKAGIGVVIRDEAGEVVVALSKIVNTPLGAVEIEAKAVEAGVSFARDVGIREAVIEGDSLIICKALQGAGDTPSSIQNVLAETLEIATSFRWFSFSHVKR